MDFSFCLAGGSAVLRFSLSDEKDAVGDGDREPTSPRRRGRRAYPDAGVAVWKLSSSCSSLWRAIVDGCRLQGSARRRVKVGTLRVPGNA